MVFVKKKLEYIEKFSILTLINKIVTKDIKKGFENLMTIIRRYHANSGV